MIDDPLDAPSTRSTLPKDQGLKSRLHPLDTAKVVHKLEEAILSESIATANDLKKSPQHQDLSGRPLHQNQHQVP